MVSEQDPQRKSWPGISWERWKGRRTLLRYRKETQMGNKEIFKFKFSFKYHGVLFCFHCCCSVLFWLVLFYQNFPQKFIECLMKTSPSLQREGYWIISSICGRESVLPLRLSRTLKSSGQGLQRLMLAHLPSPSSDSDLNSSATWTSGFWRPSQEILKCCPDWHPLFLVTTPPVLMCTRVTESQGDVLKMQIWIQ